MVHVFAYGSLMFDAVWSRVVAGDYASCEAILQGYDRKGVRNDVYPVLVPSAPHSQVQGILYLDVSATDLVRLDEFEGEYYFRKSVQVSTADLKILPAEVYILKEEYYVIIAPGAWDPDHFSTTGIHHFIKRYMDNDIQ